jgi:hypothetical protein
MSGPDDAPDGFLQRWSRRKQAATSPAPATRDKSAAVKAEADTHSKSVPPKAEPGADLTMLPPIDSITANSDIRAFLAPGVPLELSRAALRRTWLSDPDIRDFVGLAENQWDFTKPESVPGFGALDLTPDMRRLIDHVVGGASDEATVSPTFGAKNTNSPIESSTDVPAVADGGAAAGNSADQGGNIAALEAFSTEPAADAATQRDAEALPTDPLAVPRRHGRAIPK